MNEEKVKMLNIFLLGLCFCLVFTGFNSMGQNQALVYASAENITAENNQTIFRVNGLTTSGITYGVFAFVSWLAPSIVVVLGPRVSMILAALTYLFQISQYLYLMAPTVYVASVIIGIGAPIIWTAQGTFMANNSDENTITRNSGIFWAMNMSSNIIGNLIAYFLFLDQEIIQEKTWMTLGGILLSVAGAGTLVMFLLRPTPWIDTKEDVNFWSTLKDSARLFSTSTMLIFSITLFYTGLNQGLWAGVSSATIGFTEGFGPDRKALASLSAILVATGEVVGGILFGFLGHLTIKWGRYPVILLGGMLGLATYAMMFVNIPMDAPLGETSDVGFIDPSKELALTASFILGFSDSCFNTQVAAILAGFWKDQSASAFGLFKFVQSLATCASFFYAPYLGFYWQLLILTIFCIAGTVACLRVEQLSRKQEV